MVGALDGAGILEDNRRCAIDIVTVLLGLAIVVGLVGIIVPVLPGSILIAAAALVWAILNSSVAAWTVFAVMVALLGAGSVGTYVITARRTQGAGVPLQSQLGAAAAGIVGFFVIPVVGVLVFFPLGLLAMEWLRLRDLPGALQSARVALRAMLVGMGIELAAALAAAVLWTLANLWWV